MVKPDSTSGFTNSENHNKNTGATRRNILIGSVAVVLIIVVAVAALLLRSAVNPNTVPLQTARDFMAALSAQDYAKAYSYVYPDPQLAAWRSAEELQTILTKVGLADPSDVNLSDVHITSSAIVTGTATFKGFKGESRVIRVDVKPYGNTWKVVAYGLNQ